MVKLDFLSKEHFEFWPQIWTTCGVWIQVIGDCWSLNYWVSIFVLTILKFGPQCLKKRKIVECHVRRNFEEFDMSFSRLEYNCANGGKMCECIHNWNFCHKIKKSKKRKWNKRQNCKKYAFWLTYFGTICKVFYDGMTHPRIIVQMDDCGYFSKFKL